MQDRRGFLVQSAAAMGVAAGLVAAPAAPAAAPDPHRRFNLNFAPHEGMFKEHAGPDLIDQLEFMADRGFGAFEDNHMMSRPVAVQKKIGNALARLNMTMGVFVLDTGDQWRSTSLTTGRPEYHQRFIDTCRQAVEVAQRVQAKWITVVPGNFAHELPLGIQSANVLNTLRAGADILAKSNLVMVLEALSDTPEFFLRTSDQAYALCRAVDSPACKILFDMYHMQRNEGDLIQHMDLVWEEVAYFQIGDNPGRFEPGTGEMNYQNVLNHIHSRGYSGVLGTEHGNSQPGRPGELLVIDAYRRVDVPS